MRAVTLVVVLGLAACSTAPTSYMRADARPTDTAQMQSILAQCQYEGATSVVDVPGDGAIPPFAFGQGTRASKEAAIVKACMARNGYVAQ